VNLKGFIEILGNYSIFPPTILKGYVCNGEEISSFLNTVYKNFRLRYFSTARAPLEEYANSG